jgi:hypothetical protein
MSVSGCAWLNDTASEQIGVDDGDTIRSEEVRNGGFAGGDPSCKADD